MNVKLLSVAVVAICGASCGAAAAQVVRESARKIPVAYDVDVVVVGGSTHAVEAAVAAARKGASVFLAAPKTYLGEDLCATLRLWLRANEQPETALGRRLFDVKLTGAAAIRKGARFTYETSIPSAAKHRDTRKPSRLCDGRYHDAPTQSVQYDGDVTITCDLGKARKLKSVHVLAFQRDGDFEVEAVEVATSADKKTWTHARTGENKLLGKVGGTDPSIEIVLQVTAEARYVRLAVKKTAAAGRVLLGEVIIRTADDAAAKPKPVQKKPLPKVTTPMQVKVTLDAALEAAGVKFLYGCFPTDVLRDAEGKPAGIVMANRAGRQAVVAKAIIDATERATVARLAGAKFSTYPPGKHTFRQVVIGGEVMAGKGMTGRKIGRAYPVVARSRDGRSGRATGREADIIEYTLELPMKDASYASFAAAEQAARDRTWNPQVLRTSEGLFEVPPDAMVGREALRGAWPGAAKVDLGVFRPEGVDGVFVLGGCADVAREVAAKLLRPTGLMAVGERIGLAAAAEAKRRAKPIGVKLPGGEVEPAAEGDVREFLTGVRPIQDLPTVASASRPLPVVGRYDVVVIGGGTGGAPAAIAAARKGARALTVEYLHGLGGVSTMGLIGKYYHGYRGGFTAEIDQGVAAIGGQKGKSTKVDWKIEYYRREIRRAGGDLWFGCVGCGAFVEGSRVRGAVVATPAGRGVVLADVVIDATGNADVAAAAGAPYIHTAGDFLAVQGTGLPPRALGADYTNTDYTFVDETDMVDVWRLFLSARKKYRGAFDMGQLIDTRERRRIRGDVVMTILDQVNGRTYPDVIGRCRTNFDTHGYTVHPFFVPTHPEHKSMDCYVPYRCLIPSGWDGVLVIGLGISVHRDAVPLIRMQPDVQNVGYAAGCAAAMSAKSGGMVRDVDLRTLQKHLVEMGCIPAEALAWKDSYPMSKAKIAAALRDVDKSHHNVAIVMAHREQAIPMLQRAYAQAADETARLRYAHILAACGDDSGAETLIAAVRAIPKWDRGWNFRGMGQFGQALSPLDRYIIALGMAGEKKAVPAIVEKVKLLTTASEFSHHRACALALELIGEKSAARPLGELLAKPGMTGHAMLAPAAGQERSRPLREIIVARALYRLGDWKHLGRKSLESFTRDVRGHFARHAHAILQAGRNAP